MMRAVGPAPALHRRAYAEAGFTLLEVLMALAILGLAVVTLLQLSSQSLRLVKTSGDYQEAVLLADRIAAQSRPTDEAVDTGEEGPFQWERRISLMALPEELEPRETIPGREPAKLFAVTIAVRWGQNQVLELSTLRTPTTTPAAAGGQPTTSAGGQPTTSTGTQQLPIPTTGQPPAPGRRQPGGSRSLGGSSMGGSGMGGSSMGGSSKR